MIIRDWQEKHAGGKDRNHLELEPPARDHHGEDGEAECRTDEGRGNGINELWNGGGDCFLRLDQWRRLGRVDRPREQCFAGAGTNGILVHRISVRTLSEPHWSTLLLQLRSRGRESSGAGKGERKTTRFVLMALRLMASGGL